MALADTGPFSFASLIRPCQGERVSGDAAVVRPLERGLFAAIVDVLGHGAEAGELAAQIDSYLSKHATADPARVLRGLHERFRGSRGAAVGLCFISEQGKVSYVGAGNTVLRRLNRHEDSRLVSQDGTVGQNLRTPRHQELSLETGDVVLLYTDGVSDRFRPADYPGVRYDEPGTVVQVVIKRFGKGYDDAGCIAVRYDPDGR